jgi:hypothetical protein
VHRVLVGKPEGKSQMGRPRRRWEDNINPSLHFVSYMIQYIYFNIFLNGMVLPLYCWGVTDMIHCNGRH